MDNLVIWSQTNRSNFPVTEDKTEVRESRKQTTAEGGYNKDWSVNA